MNRKAELIERHGPYAFFRDFAYKGQKAFLEDVARYFISRPIGKFGVDLYCHAWIAVFPAGNGSIRDIQPSEGSENMFFNLSGLIELRRHLNKGNIK